jgi:hypothetical protein
MRSGFSFHAKAPPITVVRQRLISDQMIGKVTEEQYGSESLSVLQHVHRIDISLFIAKHFPSVQHLATVRCPLQRQEFERTCNHGNHLAMFNTM